MTKHLILILLGCLPFAIMAQQNVGIGTTNPDAQAILDVKSTTKGVLLPRMSTTLKNNLGNTLNITDKGMLVYDITLNGLYHWDGNSWESFSGGNQLWNDADPDGIFYLPGSVSIGTSGVHPTSKLTVTTGSNTQSSTNYSGQFYNNFTGSATQYGVYAQTGISATGKKYGVFGSTAAFTTATQPVYGIYGSAYQYSTSSQDAYGSYGYVGANGPGDAYGNYSEVTGNGTGDKFGTYADVTGSSGRAYGGYFKISGGTSGLRYGIYNETNAGSSQASTMYGIYNRVIPNTTQNTSSFGVYSLISGNGLGSKYAVYGAATSGPGQANSTRGVWAFANGNSSSTGQVNAIYATCGNSGTGRNVAIYGLASSTAANRWALYMDNGNSFFEDDVRIGHEDDIPGYKLSVDGKIICEELRVETSADWPDYVFAEGYNLKPLSEVEKHINKNRHLPGIPSAKQIEDQGGVDVGEMNRKLLEKVEELTLYLIEKDKQMKLLEARLSALEN